MNYLTNTVMNKFLFFRLVSFVMLLLLVACNSVNVKDAETGETVIGQEYYLNVNVWYNHPLKIMSTNYHAGSRLGIGKKVTITKLGGKKIRFTDESGGDYMIIHHRKHTSGDLQTLFDRYFGKKDITKSKSFSKFSTKVQKQIRNGEIVKGMSKDAIIMSYGYPPSHRTASLDGDRWIYWGTKWVSKAATFDNGKLVSYK